MSTAIRPFLHEVNLYKIRNLVANTQLQFQDYAARLAVPPDLKTRHVWAFGHQSSSSKATAGFFHVPAYLQFFRSGVEVGRVRSDFGSNPVKPDDAPFNDIPLVLSNGGDQPAVTFLAPPLQFAISVPCQTYRIECDEIALWVDYFWNREAADNIRIYSGLRIISEE